MTDVIIRRAELSDKTGLKSAFISAYAAYARRIPDLPDVSGGLAEDIATHHVWVAEIDGQIVGGLVLVQDQSNFHLANIAVHPDHGGKGLGRRLILKSENFARANGAETLALATHVDIPENVALYGHLGWREHSRSGNKVYMVKKL